MDFVGQAAGPLLELADDQRMDVFVSRAGEKFRSAGFRAHCLERVHDPAAFAGREDTHALQRPGERLRTANIGVNQAAIKVE